MIDETEEKEEAQAVKKKGNVILSGDNQGKGLAVDFSITEGFSDTYIEPIMRIKSKEGGLPIHIEIEYSGLKRSVSQKDSSKGLMAKVMSNIRSFFTVW